MKILANDLAQHYQITSLQRGHCIFTSFIAKNGRILFLEDHLERLIAGANFLFPKEGWNESFQRLKEYVENEWGKLKLKNEELCYFRLTLFDDCIYLQHRLLQDSSLTVKMMIAQKVKTPGPMPSFVKLSNYVESDLEVMAAAAKNFDDVVFLDHQGHVTESSTSNLFIVSKVGHLISPYPTSMILDGIMRKKLILKLKDSGIVVQETFVSKRELQKAQEIWLTNSVKGIRFVDQFEEKKIIMKGSLFEKVITLFGRHGELV
jgi:branched-chain amino acid aminotransferase